MIGREGGFENVVGLVAGSSFFLLATSSFTCFSRGHLHTNEHWNVNLGAKKLLKFTKPPAMQATLFRVYGNGHSKTGKRHLTFLKIMISYTHSSKDRLTF